MDPVSDWILLPYWSLDTDHSFCSICSVQHVRPLGHICSCEPERQKERNEKLSPKIEFLYLYSIVSNNRTKSDKKGQFYVVELLKYQFNLNAQHVNGLTNLNSRKLVKIHVRILDILP